MIAHGSPFGRLQGDFFGGLTAGVVALPLALAFGVASGAGAAAGLYGAIVLGFFAALLGGTRMQISGPTGPMTVVFASALVVVGGDVAVAMAAVMIGGLVQIGLGLLRAGGLVRFIPYPVVSGFMSGIGVIIILLQSAPLVGAPPSSSPLAAVIGLPGVFAQVNGEAVLLGDVAELTTVEEAVSITRIDGLRAATVEGRPTGDDLGATTAELTTALEALDVAEGVQVEVGGVSAEQASAFRSLGLALLAAIAIVYLVMVATFNSLVQPLILLVSVPFAATGSIGLLLVTGFPLDVASLIGLLMLIGIVVTNAIVLIDLVNQYRDRGMDRHEAVVEGARHRLRPIVMTAAATILALTPLAFAVTGGGAFLSQPLAMVVIGGLISSTLLTLILVPVLYELVERGAARIGGERQSRDPRRA